MPYAGVNDPKLPSHVQKMPADKRKQWIDVFESVLEDTGDEGEAMAVANAAVKAFTGKTAVKALETEGHIGGYLVVWGTPDHRDLQGEYFTPETDLGLDWYPRRPVLYHHGLDGKAMATMIGQIESMQPDDTGVWVEAQLNLHNKWAKAVWTLVKRGVLGWSSGSLPHLVGITSEGQIKRWPIVEGSLTPTPAEPRQTEAMSTKHTATLEHLSVAYKSAGLDMPDFLVSETAMEGGATGEGAGRGQAGSAMTNSRLPVSVKTEAEMPDNAPVVSMTPAELDAWYAQKRAEEKAAQELDDLRAKAARADAAEAELTALKAERDDSGEDEPPARRLPGRIHDGEDQVDPMAGKTVQITVGSKYDHLSHLDMAYGLSLLHGFHKADASKGLVSEQYARAFAHKAWTAGIRPIHKDGAAYKADELSHSTLTSYGDEWVPDLWSAEVWRTARQDNVVLPLFRSIEMPSNPFELPIEGTDPTVYYVPETTDEAQLALDNANNPTPDSQIGSGKVTLNAKKLSLRVGFSSELVEDSLVAILPMYREQGLRAMADAVDHVLLNGDDTTASTGNINSDDAAPAALSKYLAFNGLRHLPLVTNTANKQDASGSATLALLRTTRGLMPARYSLRVRDLAWIVDGSSYMSLLSLDQVVTMDKFGSMATVMNGEIGKLDGIPVLASAEMALTEADGKINAAGGGTKGQILCVYRPGWIVGYRRRIAASVTYLPFYDAYQMVATVRIAFINRDTEVASCLYDITV